MVVGAALASTPVSNSTAVITTPTADVGLIIGLSVGLGVFFLLMVIVVIGAAVFNAIVAYIHAKKKQKQEEENLGLTTTALNQQ